MVHMVEEGTKEYDCFWIVKPPKEHLNWKTELYLTVSSFSDFGRHSSSKYIKCSFFNTIFRLKY